jgi:uncharacterized protein
MGSDGRLRLSPVKPAEYINSNMPNPRRPFRLNVGFLVHQTVGSSHEFQFELERIKVGPDLELRDLAGVVKVGRTTQGLLFIGSFTAETTVDCVRCLQPFYMSLGWTLTELYAFREKSVSESELIVPEDAQIDLQPLIREYALLEIPISPICRQDCRGLCPVCGQDLNVRDCGHRPLRDESPFSALKRLL